MHQLIARILTEHNDLLEAARLLMAKNKADYLADLNHRERIELMIDGIPACNELMPDELSWSMAELDSPNLENANEFVIEQALRAHLKDELKELADVHE
jgi:hypothetical protein